MLIETILSLVKIGAEIFQDERKDRFLKRRKSIEEEYIDEMSKPESDRSDLTLNRLYLESEQLAELIVSESRK